jgi:hypothetical protein
MKRTQIGTGGVWRSRSAAAVVTVQALAAVLVGGAGVAAAQQPGGARGGHVVTATPPGMISTVAGGLGGPGKATKIALNSDCGVTLARAHRKTLGALVQVVAVSSGTFYHRKMVAGDIYIVAGRAKAGYPGAGRPAIKSGLGENIGDVTLDRSGNIVFAARSLGRVLVVAERTGTFYGQPMTAGRLYSVAGTRAMEGTPGTAARPPAPCSTSRMMWPWTRRESADRR